MNRLKYKSDWSDAEVRIYADEYWNGNLYIGLLSNDPEYGIEPFADLSVNIDDLPENCIAVDTNNLSKAEAFIKSNKLGKYTGFDLYSGFCSYPVYEMDMQKIAKIELHEGEEF